MTTPTPNTQWGKVKWKQFRWTKATPDGQGSYRMDKIVKGSKGMSPKELALYCLGLVAAARTTAGLAALGGTEPPEVGVLETKAKAIDTRLGEQVTALAGYNTSTVNVGTSEIETDNALGDYVATAQKATKGAPASVATLGLKLSGTGHHTSPSAPLDQPTGMHVTDGDALTALDLTCHGHRNRTGWIWQICTGDPTVEANWKELGRTTASTYHATGLLSGTKYSFRAAYTVSGQNIQSPWSDPASRIAP